MNKDIEYRTYTLTRVNRDGKARAFLITDSDGIEWRTLYRDIKNEAQAKQYVDELIESKQNL
tara:strand:- start:178 stop:363 length:186 start_codon:yes stop_codon:yes gene_type:complete